MCLGYGTTDAPHPRAVQTQNEWCGLMTDVSTMTTNSYETASISILLL